MKPKLKKLQLEGITNQLIADNAILQARIAELEKDKARLDWLMDTAHNNNKGLLLAGICYWSVTQGRTRLGEGETLREAIDAAMERKES